MSRLVEAVVAGGSGLLLFGGLALCSVGAGAPGLLSFLSGAALAVSLFVCGTSGRGV